MVMDDTVHRLVHQYGDDVAADMNLSHPKVPQTADEGMSLHVGVHTHKHTNTLTHEYTVACTTGNVFWALIAAFNLLTDFFFFANICIGFANVSLFNVFVFTPFP